MEELPVAEGATVAPTAATTASNNCRVKVGTRIRPLNASEIAQGSGSVVECDESGSLVITAPGGSRKQYDFDWAFDENMANTNVVYEKMAAALVDATISLDALATCSRYCFSGCLLAPLSMTDAVQALWLHVVSSRFSRIDDAVQALSLASCW